MGALALLTQAGQIEAQVSDPSEAMTGQGVRYDLKNCDGKVGREELADAVALELRSADAQTQSYVGTEQPTVLVFCMEEHLQVSLRDTQMASVARVRADRLGLVRFIALAVAESLAARAGAKSSVPEPEPEPDPAEAPQAPATALAHKHEGLWLRLDYFGRLQLAEGWPRLGAELTVGYAPDPYWTFELGLEMELGKTDQALGEVFATAGTFGLRVLRGAEVGDTVRLDGGLGVRGGAVSWSGTPDDPAAVQGLSGVSGWMAVGATARLTFWLVEDLGLELGAEGGWLFVDPEASADGQRLTSLGPGYLGLHIGLAWRALEPAPQRVATERGEAP